MPKDDIEKAKNVKMPSPEDFCLREPLYRAVTFDKERASPSDSLEYFIGTLDCYCEACGRHSVFKRPSEVKYKGRAAYFNYIFSLVFSCSRAPQHQLLFVFRVHNGLLQKIGQYPSLADLATPDLQKYRPVLGDERYRELTRGIGLASHDVGIGAFVYLRRIFESLIEEARTSAAGEPNWNHEEFDRARMEDKIAILKPHLPPFLVENRSLYGILSVGVHTLSEEQCLKAFPMVKVGIELILDDHLQKYERKKKINDAKKGLATLGGQLKNAKT